VIGVFRTLVLTAPFSATRCDNCAGLRKLPRATPNPAELLAITILLDRAFDMVETGPRFTTSVRPPPLVGTCGSVPLETPVKTGVLPNPAHDPPGIQAQPEGVLTQEP